MIRRVVVLSFLVALAGGAALLVHSCRQSALYLAAFPPEDFYTPLAEADISLLDRGEFSLNFSNTYRGNHTVGISVASPPKVASPFDPALDLELEILDGATLLIRRRITKATYPFWFGHSQNGGLALLPYTVPDTLPRNRSLTCTLRVLGPHPHLAQYGQARLFVAKASDL